jgi:hypothetical protein
LGLLKERLGRGQKRVLTSFGELRKKLFRETLLKAGSADVFGAELKYRTEMREALVKQAKRRHETPKEIKEIERVVTYRDEAVKALHKRMKNMTQEQRQHIIKFLADARIDGVYPGKNQKRLEDFD